VTTTQRREAVTWLIGQFPTSTRRALDLIGLGRSRWHYRIRRPSYDDLRARLRELAASKPKWGGMVHEHHRRTASSGAMASGIQRGKTAQQSWSSNPRRVCIGAQEEQQFTPTTHSLGDSALGRTSALITFCLTHLCAQPERCIDSPGNPCRDE